MTNYIRYLKSDSYKLSRSSFFIMHIAIPIIGGILLLLLSGISKSSGLVKVEGFCQGISVVFPFIIAIVCNILVEQELKAGHFQNILSLKSRKVVIISKLTILLLSGLFATFLTTFIFGVGYSFLDSEIRIPTAFYILVPLTIWVSNIFIYCLNLFISFRFGKNIGIVLGSAGSLLSALLYTGLGAGIWFMVPYSWGIYFPLFTFRDVFGITQYNLTEFYLGLAFFAILTCIILVTVIFWFSRYDGKRSSD